MKKYKLIKEYPGSPILGFKTNYPRGDYYDINDPSGLKHKYLLENNPEFWQEVTEKDYEILSFKHIEGIVPLIKQNDGNFKPENVSTSGYHESSLIVDENFKIYSVKRLSDGEIFTIGDNVTFRKNQYKIIKFDIQDTNACNKIIVTVDWTLKMGQQYEYELNSIQHYKKPLFTTEDGVEIFEGDEYYFTNIVEFNLEKPYSKIRNKKASIADIEAEKNYPNTWKNFSTKKAAEEWIIMNKPCLSYNDIISNITWLDNSKKLLKQIIKSKLNL